MGRISILDLVGLMFLYLKMTGQSQISWILVLVPFFISVSFDLYVTGESIAERRRKETEKLLKERRERP